MLCTRAIYVLKERCREERTGSSSLNFFKVVFTCVVVENSQPPAAESMSPTFVGRRRKLPPPACQVLHGLLSVVCRPRDLHFHGTVYICNQGALSSAWAHCIFCALSPCSHCRRCCCCPLQCDRWHMETCLNSAEGLGPYHRWPIESKLGRKHRGYL